MVCRCRISALCAPALAVLALMLFAPVCVAQSKPPPLGQNITSKDFRSMSPEESNQVKAYLAYWLGLLKSSTAKPEEVEAARVELIRPLTNIGVTPVFRYDYSKSIVDELEKVVAGSNIHAGVNAMLVAAALGADPAANFLLSHIHVADEPKWQIRLQAAYGCERVLAGETLDARKLQQAVDRLREAAGRETNPIILRRHLAAINVADRNSLPPDVRQKLRSVMTDALTAAVDRILKSPDSNPEPMISAVSSAFLAMRDKYVTNVMEMPEKRSMGAKLGPSLAKLLEFAASRWQDGHADNESQRLYGVAIGACQGFLGSIDAMVRGNTQQVQTKLQDAWNKGDKAKFDSELTQWLDVVKKPPYVQ